MEFGLADVPCGYEMRLSDEFVNAMDMINRPWKYDKSLKRDTRLFRAAEEIYSRLWGWGRYGRKLKGKLHDNGAFVGVRDVQLILDRLDIPYWLLEENVIGFKKGTCGRELKSRLPIKPNKFWARLLGLYWSSGSFYVRHRDGNTEENIHFSIDEEVIPMLQEITENIGDTAYETTYVPIYTGSDKAKAKLLRCRVRPRIKFSGACAFVLQKFGNIAEATEENITKNSGRHLASRDFNLNVPEWVREDGDYMQAFIEGYLNGQKGHSILHVLSNGKGMSAQVLIRFRGQIDVEVKQFWETFVRWFKKKGLTIYYRKMPRRGNSYEILIHNRKDLRYVQENFRILRTDMRARLLLTMKMSTNYTLYHALKNATSQEIVLLGLLVEKPRVKEELDSILRLKPEHVQLILSNLQANGLAIEKDGKYFADLTAYTKKTLLAYKDKMGKVEEIIKTKNQMFPYQCEDCGTVFDEKVRMCENCGSKSIEPVERRKILRPLVNRRSRQKKVINQIQSSSFSG